MQDENLRELFPGLTAEEMEIARENLDRYLEIAWEIAQAARENEFPH